MNIYQTHDYEIIAKLSQSVHDIHAKLYPDFFKEYQPHIIKAFFKSMINADNFAFFVAEDRLEPVGYAWIETRLYPETAFSKPLASVYVHQLSVIETHRGKGFGSGLMKRIYSFAKNRNIHLVELEYWTDNTPAKKFYQNQHFQYSRESVFKRL
ncbi:GNAT family N-acetyltransferase [Domibacillus indicus]|uniref:GNAT family N-acetyltransferase n=1 Tax=Domibacillus indicus TaxID=1437523 RepID=UPI000617CE2F|nr:GNAT family N-acetyltransferase [Domibacillus indicus]